MYFFFTEKFPKTLIISKNMQRIDMIKYNLFPHYMIDDLLVEYLLVVPFYRV